VEHAIAAMPSIVRERPDATLRIVGGGLRAYVESLEQRVRELGLEDRVEFLGERPREELGDLLADADIGLASSEPVAFRRYACPIKIMEYMAGGLPVIATEGTEAGDLVKRLECGLAIPYRSEALAEAVLSLLREPERYRALREGGLRNGRRMTWTSLLNKEVSLIVPKLARAGS
jgi:glycosyltransferase involved in cell wall biosynthesis